MTDQWWIASALMWESQQNHLVVAYTFLTITLQQSSGFPSSVALMPHDLGNGFVMATSGVCSLLWVSVWATSGCPATLVAGVGQAEAAGLTAAWRPPHLAGGGEETKGVKGSPVDAPGPINRENERSAVERKRQRSANKKDNNVISVITHSGDGEKWG